MECVDWYREMRLRRGGGDFFEIREKITNLMNWCLVNMLPVDVDANLI